MAIKAKAFDAERLSFKPPVHILGGNYTVPLLYDGAPLVLQLPRCTVSQGVYDQGGKHYVDVIVKQGSVTEDLVFALQRRAEQHLRTLPQFGVHECAVHHHMSIVSRDADRVYHALRLKLPRIGQRYQARVTDAHGAPRAVTHLRGGCVVLLLAAVESVYCINGIAGFNFNVKEAQLCEDDAR